MFRHIPVAIPMLLAVTVLMLCQPAALRATTNSARVCFVPPHDSGSLAALGHELMSAGLAVVPEQACLPGPEIYRGRFVHQGSGVALVLETPAGRTLDRRVPWLTSATGALCETHRLQWMQQLVVLVAGLVVEDRLAPQVLQRGVTIAAKGSERLLRLSRHEGPAALSIKPEPQAPEHSATQGPEEPTVGDPPTPAPSLVPPPDLPMRRPIQPTYQALSSHLELPSARAAQRWPWHLALDMSGRWRAIDGLGLDIVGTVRWGPILVQLGYQPHTSSAVDTMQAIEGAVGYEHTLVKARWLSLDARAALAAECQVLSHASNGTRPASTAYRWNLGPQIGLRAAIPITHGVRVGLAVDGLWLFNVSATPPQPNTFGKEPARPEPQPGQPTGQSPAPQPSPDSSSRTDGLGVRFGVFVAYVI